MNGLYLTMNQLSLDDLADLGLGIGLHHPQYYNKERDAKRAEIGLEEDKYIKSVNWTSIQYFFQLQELESRPCSERDLAQDCAWFIQSYTEYRQYGKGWDSVVEWLENSLDNSPDSQSLEKSMDMANIIHTTGGSVGHQKEHDIETWSSGIYQKENGMETWSSGIKGYSQDNGNNNILERSIWDAEHQKEADIETEAWSSGLSDISGSSATRDSDNDIMEMVSILERATRAGGHAGQQKEIGMETWSSGMKGCSQDDGNNNILEKTGFNAEHQKEADIETEAGSSGLSNISGSSATLDDDNDILEMANILERATQARGDTEHQKENGMETLELVAWQSEYRGPYKDNVDDGTDNNKSLGLYNDNLETSKPLALSGTPENELVQEIESTKLRKTIKELKKADILLSKEEIKNLHTMSLDDFDSLLERNKLTPEQKVKCKDIRRRGKNSISALNSRKRKGTVIEEMEEVLEEKLEKRGALKAEHDELLQRKLESEKKLNMVKAKVLKLNNRSPHHYTIKVVDNLGVKMAKIVRKK